MSVKNNFAEICAEAWRIAQQKGLSGLGQATRRYALYHLRDKWRFLYFQFPVERPPLAFEMKEAVTVRIATPENVRRIEKEIFPKLLGDLEYDKRYFKLIGRKDVKCFLVEKDGRLIHYSWLFLDVRDSPMMRVPFGKDQFMPGDVFVGPVFTDPAARGLWVYPYVLSCIVRYLQESGVGKRILIFVDGKNEAARPFYKRFGFDETGAGPRGLAGCVMTAFNNPSRMGWLRKGIRFALHKEKTT